MDDSCRHDVLSVGLLPAEEAHKSGVPGWWLIGGGLQGALSKPRNQTVRSLSLISLLRPFGLVELVRLGKILMTRGPEMT
jgi:hypothetical protein